MSKSAASLPRENRARASICSNASLLRFVHSFSDAFKCCFNDALGRTNVHTHETAALFAKQNARTHADTRFMHKKIPELGIRHIQRTHQPMTIQPEQIRAFGLDEADFRKMGFQIL